MHNIHYIVVKAGSGEEAVSMAESSVLYWGNDNNWHAILGAISEKGEIYKKDKFFNSCLEEINKKFDDIEEDSLLKDAFKRVKNDKIQDVFDWYLASRYCREKYYLLTKEKPFNVLKNEYKSGHFDEFGATHFFNEDEDDELSKWVVVVDMHS